MVFSDRLWWTISIALSKVKIPEIESFNCRPLLITTFNNFNGWNIERKTIQSNPNGVIINRTSPWPLMLFTF